MVKKVSLLLIASLALILVSCNEKSNQEKQNQKESKDIVVQEKSKMTISKQEVLDVQKVWGDGIVRIGKVFSENGDYTSEAEKHIDELYGYNLGAVLFKPTLASEKQFRTTKEGALSYFVGHNENYPEDHGFAIKPWIKVRWESIGIKTEGNMAIAMGNYYFTPANGEDEVKVEYTFAYTKDKDGKLRIIMHGSHLPYSPKK